MCEESMNATSNSDTTDCTIDITRLRRELSASPNILAHHKRLDAQPQRQLESAIEAIELHQGL